MKIRIHRWCALTLISLLSLFAVAVQSAAQDQTFNPISHSHKPRAKAGKTLPANPADGAASYNYEVLYSFGANSTDGSSPAAGLIQDAAGNLYGTTPSGGAKSSGTVFKLAPPAQGGGTWTETVLYSFCSVGGGTCTDGSTPDAGLIQDAAANLYGTTSQGGANNTATTGYRGGTVFKLAPPAQQGGTWTETVLYNFCSVGDCLDGYWPLAGVIQDAAGNFYGTTADGDANNGGTVFKLGSTGETVLYSFCSAASCSDGASPYAGLTRDAAGNLYGTTHRGGGSNPPVGTVFKVDGTDHETLLHSFCPTGSYPSCTDGDSPYAGLIQDSAGNLYGTTPAGGNSNSNCRDPNGFDTCGTLFKLDSTGHETVLYSFCSAASCSDGASPYAGLIRDAAGNLYGTTASGGANNHGTVFEVNSTGQETVLYNFCSDGGSNCTDGYDPMAGLIQDAAGNLYGTTSLGGAHNLGIVFRLAVLMTPTVTVTPSSSSITTAQALSVTVAVSGGSGNPTPTGTVTLTSGSYSSGATTLTSGSATINISAGSLAVGSDTLTATYSGDSNYATATGTNSVVVTVPPTPTVTVTPSSSSITTAQALSVTVGVSGGSGNPTPTGTVTLTSGTYSSGATTLTSGSATINIPAGSLAVGTDTLTATYSGDNNYATATGANAVIVTVPATPTVTVTPSSSSITTTQALSVTVAVSGGSGNPTPTGTVTLTSGTYNSGATTLTSGSATINIPAGSLATGKDTLTATYSGDSNYATATGAGSVTVTVPPSFTVSGTTVSVSPGAATGNTSTITLTPSGGFTGSVTLTAALTSSPIGAQDPPTLSFGATSPVTITGTSAVTATLTIATTAPTTGALAYPARPGVRWYAGGTTLAFGLIFGIGICVPARRSWRRRLGLLVLLVVLAGGLLSCSNSSGSGGTGNPGTTPGTYTVTVTGTSGSTTATGTVTLTVQ
jgi:uncharacterized repeat protein (TIGR03803 family)